MAKIFLKNVRLAFPQLFEAKQINGEGEPKFGGNALISKKDLQIADIRKVIEQVAKEKWADKYKPILDKCYKDGKVCLRDGDDKAEYDGYPGNYFISASSKTRPLVLAADKSPLTQKDGKPYAGCYVYMQIEIWAQDNKYGKRINAELKGVQFFRDGDAFTGSAPSSADEFEALEAPAEDSLAD